MTSTMNIQAVDLSSDLLTEYQSLMLRLRKKYISIYLVFQAAYLDD